MGKTFLLYGHGGAYNHGAEAIVKCTVQLIKRFYPESRIILSTHFKDQDLEFHMPVDEYCERDFGYVALDKSSASKGKYDAQIYRSTLEKITGNTVCLSVGGDNYCYDNWHRWKTIHETAIERGAVSILWSCSIEPSALTGEMADTLKTHHLITARESLTLNALREKGLRNVLPCSDIAFLLEPEPCSLPENFIAGNTVCVNISPLVLRREPAPGIILRNYENLIRYIIEHTDMHVALVPHVVMPTDNDFLLLQNIYNSLKPKERICLVSGNLSAGEYKYIIAQSRFGVFARTHASIAAYSSFVPAVVTGYSVKSRGIALDLGFTDYLLQLEDFESENILTERFKDLIRNERQLRRLLAARMPDYKKRSALNPLSEKQA